MFLFSSGRSYNAHLYGGVTRGKIPWKLPLGTGQNCWKNPQWQSHTMGNCQGTYLLHKVDFNYQLTITVFFLFELGNFPSKLELVEMRGRGKFPNLCVILRNFLGKPKEISPVWYGHYSYCIRLISHKGENRVRGKEGPCFWIPAYAISTVGGRSTLTI